MKVLKMTLGLLITLTAISTTPQESPAAPGAPSAPTAQNATIPPGTRITPQNWQRYKQFMSLGMQALFSGRYFWKIPADSYIEVGTTVPIALPRKYQQDTERYASQVKLRRVDTGGYTVDGYVAGMPFPQLHSNDPLAGYKAMYDAWYGYRPPLWKGGAITCNVDRFHSAFCEDASERNFKLTHLSEPKMPATFPGAGGDLMYAVRLEVLSPEQNKYTTALTLTPDNLMAEQENYVFLPSLRRSLRLSTAARCAPLLGTDFTPEDEGGFNIQPLPNFSAKYLGERQILWVAHAAKEFLHASSYQAFGQWYDVANAAFPRPELGKWELREVYVFEMRPLPSYHGYCYSRRIVYLDKETLAFPWTDLFDAHGKFWKFDFVLGYPIKVNDGASLPFGPSVWAIMYDIQNDHMSVSGPAQLATANDPDSLSQLSVFTTPAGLAQVMK